MFFTPLTCLYFVECWLGDLNFHAAKCWSCVTNAVKTPCEWESVTTVACRLSSRRCNCTRFQAKGAGGYNGNGELKDRKKTIDSFYRLKRMSVMLQIWIENIMFYFYQSSVLLLTGIIIEDYTQYITVFNVHCTDAELFPYDKVLE